MSGTTEVLLIRTGVANLASVQAGLRRAGAAPRITTSPDEVRSAAAVLLPGVGAFEPGMTALEDTGMAAALQERIREDRPTLAICLGLQLLLDGSEESASNRKGLGVLNGRATRLPSTVRVPQLGWNHIEADPTCRVLRSGAVYFANSYRLAERPAETTCAVADHGGPFVAALERGNLVACQFHPELSGALGQQILRNWLSLAAEEAPC